MISLAGSCARLAKFWTSPYYTGVFMPSPKNPFIYAWTKDSVLQLIDEIQNLHDEGRFKYASLVEACLVTKGKGSIKPESAQQKFSRWIHTAKDDDFNWRGLNRLEFEKVRAYVHKIVHLSDERPHIVADAMFFGMLGWLESDAETIQDLSENFPGQYTIYRHSFTLPGQVAVGRLTISLNEASGAVVTEEEHSVGAKLTPTNYTMKGYLARKRGRYYIFSLHQNHGQEFIQLFYINGEQRRGGKQAPKQINLFYGVLSDVQGHTYYSSRFACERSSGIIKPDCIPFSDVPLTIKNHIETPPRFMRQNDTSVGYITAF